MALKDLEIAISAVSYASDASSPPAVGKRPGCREEIQKLRSRHIDHHPQKRKTRHRSSVRRLGDGLVFDIHNTQYLPVCSYSTACQPTTAVFFDRKSF
jgi:hypothetical protein